MNKIYYQLTNSEYMHGTDSNTFMYLNHIEDDIYERLDKDMPPGEGSHYTLEEFEHCFVDDELVTSFKLELIYD